MKKKTDKLTASSESLRAGQIWRMQDSDLQIGLVGKNLVHYKHYKGQTKRSPVSLTGKDVLGKYLKANKAVLVAESRP